MDKIKIAIIGSGIVGLSSGINLLKRGAEVTLIERDFKGQPASYGHASWLSSPSPSRLGWWWRHSLQPSLKTRGWPGRRRGLWQQCAHPRKLAAGQCADRPSWQHWR